MLSFPSIYKQGNTGKVVLLYYRFELVCQKMVFFLEDAADRKTYTGALVTYAPTHQDVMWWYMGCDVMWCASPDSKVHGANMGPIWDREDPDGPHVGPMNLVGENRGVGGPGVKGSGVGGLLTKMGGGGGQMGGGRGNKTEFWAGVPEKNRGKGGWGVGGGCEENLGGGRGVEPRG